MVVNSDRLTGFMHHCLHVSLCVCVCVCVQSIIKEIRQQKPTGRKRPDCGAARWFRHGNDNSSGHLKTGSAPWTKYQQNSLKVGGWSLCRTAPGTVSTLQGLLGASLEVNTSLTTGPAAAPPPWENLCGTCAEARRRRRRCPSESPGSPHPVLRRSGKTEDTKARRAQATGETNVD